MMRFSYLILAHKNPRQLCRLLKSIMTDHAYIFIHLDRKSNLCEFKEVLTPFKNVELCTRQIQVSWVGFGMIEATLELMNTMFLRNVRPDYVHLISVQDFPLKSNAEIFRFFIENKGENFLEASIIPSPYLYDSGWIRIRYNWFIEEVGFQKARELVAIQKQRNMVRPYFADIQPYNGSQWWSLTGECVRWIYETCRPGYRLYDFYKHTFVPDEMLFQTMLKNSAWKDTIVDHNLRNINWSEGPEYPKIWRSKDFERLIGSGKFFARKFDENVDNQIIEQLENHILSESILDKSNISLNG